MQEHTMRISIAFMALLMTGCTVLTPTGLREQGLRFEKTLNEPPRAAAYCVRRNVENTADLSLGTAIPSIDRGAAGESSMEFLIPDVLVADIAPAGKGSVARIHASPYIMRARVDRYVNAFDGC